jgi:predicted enzyme related to lactoylglutathione lyase
MLAKGMAVATLPAVDLKRAKKFYEDNLGFKVMMEDPSPGIMFKGGKESMIYVYQRASSKADHTVAAFVVDDIEAEVKELKHKGVKFEEYDIPSMGLKTVDSIATMVKQKGAWFKDSEGNILSVVQLLK